jgi:transcriptional regulator with XRE-family HTH domain
MTPFSRKLLALRIARTMRQKELARRLEVDPAYLSRIERAKAPPPADKEFIRRVATAMGLSPVEFKELDEASNCTRSVIDFGTTVTDYQAQLAQQFREQLLRLTRAEAELVSAILRFPERREQEKQSEATM